MKNFLIKTLFWLLGNDHRGLYKINYLFGVTNSEERKKRWENALIRVWKDKDLLDWFYYQSESDKERAWQGKIDKKLSQGARVRTLFIVYSARRAYEERVKGRTEDGQEKDNQDQEIKSVKAVYNSLVDID
jgi:hypothetical protein